jgi:hypothetical protein
MTHGPCRNLSMELYFEAPPVPDFGLTLVVSISDDVSSLSLASCQR